VSIFTPDKENIAKHDTIIITPPMNTFPIEKLFNGITKIPVIRKRYPASKGGPSNNFSILLLIRIRFLFKDS
jgi:hypothetical protein